MYRGNEPIKSAVEFVNKLHKTGIPHMFITNNSSKSRENISQKLNHMGVASTPEQIVTSSIATAMHLKRSEEHTSELQSRGHLVCRPRLEKKTGPLERHVRRLPAPHGAHRKLRHPAHQARAAVARRGDRPRQTSVVPYHLVGARAHGAAQE